MSVLQYLFLLANIINCEIATFVNLMSCEIVHLVVTFVAVFIEVHVSCDWSLLHLVFIAFFLLINYMLTEYLVTIVD